MRHPGPERPARTDGASLRRTLLREQILNRAADVFDARGFAQSRMADVADALAMSRSALYHYFTSKEDILAALVEQHTRAPAAWLGEVAGDATRPAPARLRTMLSRTVGERLANGSRLRFLDQSVRDMPPGLRARFDQGRRQILDVYTALIAEGARDGSFRAVDPRTAALAVLGIASWTSWWYSPQGRRSPGELTDELVDIALHGLAARGEGAADRARVVAEIRERLDLLAPNGHR